MTILFGGKARLGAGNLDFRIALQRKTMSYSPSGVPVETWSSMAVRWSELQPLTGLEVSAAEQWVAREQTRFTIRWDISIEDLSPLDRIICPAADAGNSPLDVRSVYDIMKVHMLGRRETLVIDAARRVG